jgi:hypothetical protein
MNNGDIPMFPISSDSPTGKIIKQAPIIGDYEKAKYCVSELKSRCIDITVGYDAWFKICCSLSTLGESGRDLFHEVSQLNEGYNYQEADKQFSDVIKRGEKGININTFFQYCKDAGVNISNRLHKPESSINSSAAKPEEPKTNGKKNDFDEIQEYLNSIGLYRNAINQDYYIGDNRQSEQDLNGIFINYCKVNKASKTNFETVINSNKIKSVNPIKDFFESRKSTNQDLITKWVSTLKVKTGYNGETFINNYADIFLRKWIVGLVASIEGDNSNTLMPVLIGPKNIGKTEFARRTMPAILKPYFCQSKLDQGKDSEAQMCEYLLILNDELDGMSRHEAKSFRNFISANQYTYRPPYAKKNITRKRLASLFGTSNDIQIIADHENNRRIIPIEITGINYELLNSIDKEELLIEAFSLYKSGFDYHLTKGDITILSSSTEEYAIAIPEHELITKFFKVPTEDNQFITELSATDIKDHIERHTKQRMSPIMVGKALKNLGFEVVHKKTGKSTKRIYRVIEIVNKPINEYVYNN